MSTRTIPILAAPASAAQPAGKRGALARIGSAMQRHRSAIMTMQWLVVLLYLSLLIVPAFMPLPPEDAHLYDNLRLFAQFLFWGIWWPFVMLSTMLFGRVWCGVFCPEGALTEFASRHGLGKPIPRWMRWGGWPLFAFTCTTVYGQLLSVYEYPQAALLILGGSSLAAVGIGFVYGKGKRVWCRYLCPANGIFSLLAKIAPLHFRVDEEAWKRSGAPQARIDCAPLIDVRHMKSASACHSCGRCSDHRGAVQFAARSPAAEILSLHNKDVRTEEALALAFGAIGVAMAAFLWSSSTWLVAMKTAAAQWLIEHDSMLLLQDNAPWWMLTHYPAAHDVFTWLDGLCILIYVLGGGAALGLTVLAGIRLAAAAARRSELSWQRLAMALVPLAGVGVFLGLSMLTISHLKAERIGLEWLPVAREILLAAGTVFSVWLGWKMLLDRISLRGLLAFALFSLPVAVIDWVWISTFVPM